MLKQLSKEQAVKLYETEFWVHTSEKDLALFQITQDKLCMPFGIFHKAIENTLGRPIFTHEFATNVEELKAELLDIMFENKVINLMEKWL